MQRIKASRGRRPRGHERVLGGRHSTALTSVGTSPATRIATLAPGFCQALPTLDVVPTEYNHEANAELLYELGAALVKEGFGSPETWQRCDGNPILFAQLCILDRISTQRTDLLERNADFHLQVSDVFERDGYGSPFGNGQLAVTIECGSAGYLKIGPALDALEKQSEGLGAAFYWSLLQSLYPVMRIYDHADALQYEEGYIESANQDDEENRDQYEFPEVQKAIPEFINKTLKKKSRLTDRGLLRAHRNGPFQAWIERLDKLQRLSRLPHRQTREHLEDYYYDGPPLPSLLLSFKAGDAIVACFDEEAQYMLESSPEPVLCIRFSPYKADEVRRALRGVERFIAFNVELFALAEDLQNWEQNDEGPYSNRGEPSLRAA